MNWDEYIVDVFQVGNCWHVFHVGLRSNWSSDVYVHPRDDYWLFFYWLDKLQGIRFSFIYLLVFLMTFFLMLLESWMFTSVGQTRFCKRVPVEDKSGTGHENPILCLIAPLVIASIEQTRVHSGRWPTVNTMIWNCKVHRLSIAYNIWLYAS